MKTLAALVTATLFLATSHTAHAACAEVFIISFDVELYMPENEATIEGRSFSKLYASPTTIAELAAKVSEFANSANYDPDNVRAVVKSDNGRFYIDRFGGVRQDNKFGKIDAKGFEEKLTTECVE